jgi:folate-dependent phosphoribosylglycinamide formyltransferase PurN
MALIWLELHRLESDPCLVSAACKAIDLVKRAQPMEVSNPGIDGGIPGSDPVWGSYLYMRIPNWSAKFFIDAVIEKQALLKRLAVPPAADPRIPAPLRSTVPDVSEPASGLCGLRIILYASPRTSKVREMVTAWRSWGFRPTAVIVSRDARSSLRVRILNKLRDEGVGVLVRRILGSKPAAAPAPQPSTTGATESVVDYCHAMGVEVMELPNPLNAEESVRAVQAIAPDLAVHAGAGILREPILAIPRLGTVNAHMGILPRYRGMNVSEWSRLLGDPVGCTVHLIDEGIDTGDILCCRAIATARFGSIATLRAAVNEAQITLLGEVVRYIAMTGTLPPRHPQTLGEGRQFFTMHQELRRPLEEALRRGVTPPPQACR